MKIQKTGKVESFTLIKKYHRMVVPKRIPIMGWTFNFAHPAGYIFLVLNLLFIIFQSIYSR